MEINIVEMNARLYQWRGRHCLQKLTRIFEQPEVITFERKSRFQLFTFTD